MPAAIKTAFISRAERENRRRREFGLTFTLSSASSGSTTHTDTVM